LDRVVTEFEKKLFSLFPPAQKLLRAIIYWAREFLVLNFVYRWPTRWINIALVRYFLRQQIDSTKHPDLLAKVEPSWELGCKRVLLSNDWYPALQQDNVEVETNGITEVFEHGIVTREGKVYDNIDCIVYGTGFNVQPQAQKLPISVYGRNGLLLDDHWCESVQAYKGMTLPSFPNFFLMLGYVNHNTFVSFCMTCSY
jgi:cation diffusion facilitator CzcD-associated flavoprotein CzcO